jgi:O-antigen chain-terminating methyltransferase
LHSTVPGVDPGALTQRVDAEMRSACVNKRLQSRIIPPTKNANGTVFPKAAEGPAPVKRAALPSPARAPAPSPPPPADRTGTRGQKMQKRAKALEQAIHRWLYRHKYLKEEVARVRAMIEEANGQLIAVHTTQERLDAGLAQLASEVRDTTQRFDDRLTDTARDLAATKRDFSVLQGDMLFQRRRLARLTDDLPVETRAATEGPATEAAVPPNTPPTGVDALYVGFEDRFRGPWLEIKERLRPHVERVRSRRPAAPGKPLLDIGCGRGEWLELLSEAGIEAYGVDSNEYAVAACARRGLPARHADALAHLAGLPDGALGAISIFHVIEHLPTEILLKLLDEARRTLMPGGLLMLETPNPESIKVGASTFYTDPTHLRPIPPQVAEFLVGRCGFVNLETVRLNPYPESAIIREDTEAARRLNELMYGPQDYAILAQRA